MAKQGSFFGNSFGLLKQTFSEWIEEYKTAELASCD
jgi:hypothetical protein